MQILFRMPNWLGDAVMATPLLAIARKRWPEAEILVVTKPSLSPLYQGMPGITIHHDYPRNADLGILTTNSFSTAWELFRSRAQKRIGFRNECRSLLLTDPLPFPKERGFEHLVTTYKRLLNAAADKTAPQLIVKPEEAAGLLPEDRPLIGINAQAAYGPAKCWLPDRFREVARRLSRDYCVVFFGDREGQAEIEAIAKGLDVINLAGKTTLRQLMAALSKLSVFLTNDSGPMHVAAALRVPLVALFGSTNEVATGPYEWGEVIHKHVPCSPCYRRTCPIDFPCMKQIEVDEVIEKLLMAVGKEKSTLEQ